MGQGHMVEQTKMQAPGSEPVELLCSLGKI